jgi:hypothetical protein
MTHSRYLREMARLMRVQRQLSVDQLAKRLALPRSTIYYWIRDLPLGEASAAEPRARSRDGRAAGLRTGAAGGDGGGRGGGARVARPKRAGAYGQALRSYDDLAAQPTFRDFVCVYIADGYKRDRRRVAVASADPDVIRLAHRWIWRLTDKSPALTVRYAREQSREELRRFWSEAVGEELESIRARRGSAEELQHAWSARPLHGVLTLTVDDSVLRARMQAWMRRARESWH